MPRRAAVLGAAGRYRAVGSTGGTGGGGTGGGTTQTLGVGGIPTASGANVTLISADSGSTLNITTSNRIYDGQGHTVPKITIAADGVTVQNFYVRGGGNAGIYSTGSNNTIQNNDVAQINDGGEGDINGITFFGDGTRILFNAIGKGTLLAVRPVNGSHTDGIQTWNTPSKRSSSNVTIKGNWIDGPTASDDRYIHQGVTAEGDDATSGGGGGTGDSTTWLIDGNYFRTYGNQCLELRDIQGVTVTRNTFAGSATKIINSGDGSTVTYYADNIVTGSYGSVGVGVTAGSGPGDTSGSGTTGSGDGTQAAVLYGWGTPDTTWSDEFGYTGAPNTSKWSVYDSAGHAGNGVRDPDRVDVAAGKMTLTGLAGSANTAGMAHKLTRTYGRYEIRCRSFYTSSPTTPGTLSGGYHPVLIIWPANDDWPGNGEYDWLENGEPGEQAAGAFMHYPSLDGDDHQIEVPGYPVDLREFHNFAFEWSASGLRGWVDGTPWFSYSGGSAADRKNIQAMTGGQLTVQLDAFQASSCIASTFELEWVRIYNAP